MHFFFQILKIWEKKCFHWQRLLIIQLNVYSPGQHGSQGDAELCQENEEGGDDFDDGHFGGVGRDELSRRFCRRQETGSEHGNADVRLVAHVGDDLVDAVRDAVEAFRKTVG